MTEQGGLDLDETVVRITGQDLPAIRAALAPERSLLGAGLVLPNDRGHRLGGTLGLDAPWRLRTALGERAGHLDALRGQLACLSWQQHERDFPTSVLQPSRRTKRVE